MSLLLHPPLRQAADNDRDGIAHPWAGIGVGLTVLVTTLVVLRCFRRRKPLQRTQNRPTPSRNTAYMPTPPAATYDASRYMMYNPPQNWNRYPYHVSMTPQVLHVPLAQHNIPHPVVQEQPDVQRFNPNDLLSFDISGDDAKNPCPICLGLLEEESVSAGQCLHVMHTSCLKSWLAKDVQSACPVCRVPFTDPVADAEDMQQLERQREERVREREQHVEHHAQQLERQSEQHVEQNPQQTPASAQAGS